MKIKDWISLLVVGVLLVACVVFFSKLRSTSYDYDELQTLLSDTVNHYETIVTNQGKEISIQTQRVATLDNAIAAGLVREDELKEKNLKQVTAIIRLTQEVVRLNIVADITDAEVITITDTVSVMPPGSYLKVPADFFYSDDWTLISGVILGHTIRVDNLKMKTQPSIFLGYQKAGFFKPLRPVVTVEDLNPYVSTIHMENVIIRQKPPFYKRPWWKRLEGAAIIIGAQIIFNKTR